MSVAVCKYVPSVLTLRWVAFFRLFLYLLWAVTATRIIYTFCSFAILGSQAATETETKQMNLSPHISSTWYSKDWHKGVLGVTKIS